jgi:flagellar biosynthesis/type III secretory pathway protein FliH
MYLLKHIYDMPNVPDMFQDEPFSYAFRVAEYSALSEEEQLLYRQNLKTLSDAELVLEAKLDEGIAKGRAEGRTEGMAQGKAEGLLTGIETALDIKFGSKATSLLDTIRQIQVIAHLQAILNELRTTQTLEEVEQLVNQYIQG